MNRGRIAPDVAGILIPVADIVKRIPILECKRMYTNSWRCVRAHLRGFLREERLLTTYSAQRQSLGSFQIRRLRFSFHFPLRFFIGLPRVTARDFLVPRRMKGPCPGFAHSSARH